MSFPIVLMIKLDFRKFRKIWRWKYISSDLSKSVEFIHYRACPWYHHDHQLSIWTNNNITDWDNLLFAFSSPQPQHEREKKISSDDWSETLMTVWWLRIMIRSRKILSWEKNFSCFFFECFLMRAEKCFRAPWHNLANTNLKQGMRCFVLFDFGFPLCFRRYGDSMRRRRLMWWTWANAYHKFITFMPESFSTNFPVFASAVLIGFCSSLKLKLKFWITFPIISEKRFHSNQGCGKTCMKHLK